MDKIQLEDKGFKRIWLVSSTWEKGVPFTPDAAAVKDYMDQEFRKASSKERDGINVGLYTKRIY